jgi:hypothetical protein
VLRLYLACDAGDRIYSCDPKTWKLIDETAKRKLATRSRAAAWADFNLDGRLDLLSWDGKGLSRCLQQADGSFAAPAAVPGAPGGQCLGIAVTDSGQPGKPALIWSGEKGPSLMIPAGAGSYKTTRLPTGKVDLAKLGASSTCLVGDIDGDSLNDVLWPCSKGSVFFKGTALGKLAEGRSCVLFLGKLPGSAFFGDYDMDGRLDIFSVSQSGCLLWHNRPGREPGSFRLEESIGISGEVPYISRPGGLCGNTCDVNNDGRQDLFWVYSPGPGVGTELGPHIFFNRGFRSFGHAHKLDLTEKDQYEIGGEETKGQQHGVIADFNGDGTQDMAIVLKNGDFYFCPQSCNQEGLVVRACLPVGGKVAGPVKVTAWSQRCCLGAWNLVPGLVEGFFAQMEPGEVTLKWRLPGSEKTVTKKVTLEDKAIRLPIK